MEMINDLWVLFVCAAFVVGFVVGSKVAEKEERRLFDRYKCFNVCKFRNDPNFVLPIKFDDIFGTKPIETTFPKKMTYEQFKKDTGL